jgi:hypothetical protein
MILKPRLPEKQDLIHFVWIKDTLCDGFRTAFHYDAPYWSRSG